MAMKPKGKPALTMKVYETSAADRKADKTGSKKVGVLAKQWEGSAADRKADRAGMKKVAKRK
jgi:hypothetical protein